MKYLQCCDDNSVLAAHTGGKLGTHRSDKALDVVTVFTRVISDGDDLYRPIVSDANAMTNANGRTWLAKPGIGLRGMG